MLTYPNQIQKTIQTKSKKQFNSDPNHIQIGNQNRSKPYSNHIQTIFNSDPNRFQNSAAGHNRDRGNLKYLYKEGIVTEIIRPAMRF